MIRSVSVKRWCLLCDERWILHRSFHLDPPTISGVVEGFWKSKQRHYSENYLRSNCHRGLSSLSQVDYSSLLIPEMYCGKTWPSNLSRLTAHGKLETVCGRSSLSQALLSFDGVMFTPRKSKQMSETTGNTVWQSSHSAEHSRAQNCTVTLFPRKESALRTYSRCLPIFELAS